jgi:hypothetical protein
VIARALRARCSLLQDQEQGGTPDEAATAGQTLKPLLEVLVVDKEEDSEYEWLHVSTLLRLPVCDMLQELELDFLYDNENTTMIREGRDLVASYIARPGAGMCLRKLSVSLDDDNELHLGRLALALKTGGAPNLDELRLVNMGEVAVGQIGEIYRAGGLSKLGTLQFSFSLLREASMRALFDGIRATEHKGSALKAFLVDFPNPRNRRTVDKHGRAASHVFIEALADGYFPNLENISVLFNLNQGLFLHGNCVWHAFVKAVLRGAPFINTIRVVQFEYIREIYQQMMQRALPNTEIIGQLMAEGMCYGHGAVDSDDDYGDSDAGDY